MASTQFRGLHPLAKIAVVIMTGFITALGVGVLVIILGLVYKAVLAVWS